MIGVFDSGIGGLTVVKWLQRGLPGLGLLYFGDEARYPYGNKSAETVVRYSIENTTFLLSHGAQVIVVACNTASSIVMDALREEFPDTPFFDVITPAIVKARETTKNKRIGVIGTRTTVASGVYEKLLHEQDTDIAVFPKACPLLVPLVEEGWVNKPETKTIVKKYLFPLQQEQIDTLILGCTHYPLLEELIAKKMGKRVALIDPAKECARQVREYFAEFPDKADACKGESQFFLSDVTPYAKEVAARFLGERVDFQEASSES